MREDGGDNGHGPQDGEYAQAPDRALGSVPGPGRRRRIHLRKATALLGRGLLSSTTFSPVTVASGVLLLKFLKCCSLEVVLLGGVLVETALLGHRLVETALRGGRLVETARPRGGPRCG